MSKKATTFATLSTLLVSAFTALGLVATPVYAAPCPSSSLLGIPAWYSGLQDKSTCEIVKIGKGGMDVRVFVVKIALNIIRAALVLVGYIAVFFIIKGGFLYITARGEPAHIASAKQTITNAIIGLIIALLSAAIVGAISGAIR